MFGLFKKAAKVEPATPAEPKVLYVPLGAGISYRRLPQTGAQITYEFLFADPVYYEQTIRVLKTMLENDQLLDEKVSIVRDMLPKLTGATPNSDGARQVVLSQRESTTLFGLFIEIDRYDRLKNMLKPTTGGV